MSKENDNWLINLETERDALKHATGSDIRLQAVLARISAEVTQQAMYRHAVAQKTVQIKMAEVDVRTGEDTWPETLPFPFTPLEAWYLLQGFSVKPTQDVPEESLRYLQNLFACDDGYFKLRSR